MKYNDSMLIRAFILSALAAGAMALAGCANQDSPRLSGDPRLKGYEPWTAPATDSMVDLWYLTCTPEEFDRYWLEPAGWGK